MRAREAVEAIVRSLDVKAMATEGHPLLAKVNRVELDKSRGWSDGWDHAYHIVRINNGDKAEQITSRVRTAAKWLGGRLEKMIAKKPVGYLVSLGGAPHIVNGDGITVLIAPDDWLECRVNYFATIEWP